MSVSINIIMYHGDKCTPPRVVIIVCHAHPHKHSQVNITSSCAVSSNLSWHEQLCIWYKALRQPHNGLVFGFFKNLASFLQRYFTLGHPLKESL